MGTCIEASTLNFLADLQGNNNREWFQQNRNRYELAFSNFYQLVLSLIAGIGSFDKNLGSPDPKDCIFRIYRDVRFSPNKMPYKQNFGAYIAKGGKKSNLAGYYIHIEPHESFAAGGIYMAPSDIMRRVREDIYDYPEDFLSIVNSKKFRGKFSFEDAESLGKVPRGFEAGTAVDEYLKLKNLIPSISFSDSSIQKETFVDEVLQVYKALQPLVGFINQAINQ